MACEMETPGCIKDCSKFERVKSGFWDGGVWGENGEPIKICGPMVRFVCGRTESMSWEDYKEFKGFSDVSGH